MSFKRRSVPDAARARLRATVAAIDREMSRVRGELAHDGRGDPLSGLATSWAGLVAQLALGPEPEPLTPQTLDEGRTAGTEGYDIGGEC